MKMMPNKTYELRSLYFEQSNRYDNSADQTTYPPLLSLPTSVYFDRLKPDTELLQEALVPIADEGMRVSQQVFGNDIKQQHVSMRHLANLFYERCGLHRRHIREIDRRHIEIQERKFGAEINHTQDSARRMSALETQLLQLDSARREEELAFWKDTVDLREKLFETSGSYRAAMQRYDLFATMEGSYVRPE